MTAELKFIMLDDQTHVVGFSEHTACGLPIPMGETYTFDEPKSLCTQCRKLTEDTDEYGVLKADIERTAEEVAPGAPDPDPTPDADTVATGDTELVDAPTPADTKTTTKKAAKK